MAFGKNIRNIEALENQEDSARSSHPDNHFEEVNGEERGNSNIEAPSQQYTLQPDYKRRNENNVPGEKQGNEKSPIERKSTVTVEKTTDSKTLPLCAILLIIGLVSAVIILIVCSVRNKGQQSKHEDERSTSNISVNDTKAYVETSESPDNDLITVTEVIDNSKEEIGKTEESEIIEDSREIEAPKPTEKSVSKVYIPSASGLTSSKAYDLYSSYITDEKLGPDWENSEVVRRAKANGEILNKIIAYGTIDGHPFKIKGVELENGRYFGRYINDDNGINLDVNGALDSKGNLVLKLGHKSETSYFFLQYYGFNFGEERYVGTWGKAEKSATLSVCIDFD